MITTPCNPHAIKEVKNVIEYLGEIEGKGIITGQHTQTMEQEELLKIQKVTGKLPALCGFELLSYSPNIKLETASAACVTEVMQNRGTLNKAWEWAQKGGLITFTWHWFSPLGSRDKSFYSENTDFNAERALLEDTPEHIAMCNDLDYMASLLQPFCEKNIPILWRPFHESEGAWFWWGAKGTDTARELYRFMYHYYTEKYQLDNLIWVWNSPLAEGYVGDNYCDIISRDIYPPAYAYGYFKSEYDDLKNITAAHKGAALAENGILPNVKKLADTKVPWLWYMIWSGAFVLTENYNEYVVLKELYNHDYAITLDKLPKLY